MKAQIHPTWFPKAKVTCACGNTFETGSVQEEIRVEVCSACHPFFTGQMRYVDAAGRVDKFRERMNTLQNQPQKVSKKDKRLAKRQEKIQEELSRPETLAQIRKNLQ